ncbi:MAG TPA: hypothetical protein VIC87_09030, partial [Vicinamibacteria bacterium]
LPRGRAPSSVCPTLHTGQDSHANLLVTKTLLLYGEGRGGDPNFRAVDKKTGKEVGKVALPARTNTAPMTYMHEGHQYVVAAISSESVPAELVALALPDAKPGPVAPAPNHPSESLPATRPARSKPSWPR